MRTRTAAPATSSKSSAPSMPWNDINQSGAYVTAQGSLVRVQPDGLKEQHSPLITVVSNDDTRLTMISDNPNVPIGKARVLAADFDLPVNF